MTFTTPMRAHVALGMALAAFGCEDHDEETPTPPPIEAAPEVPEDPADAGVDGGHDAGPPRPPARIFAKRFVSKIRERPDRDSFRIGYLRAGAVVMATTGHPVRADDPRCRGGWYELTTGGYVCNGRDVIAFWGRRLPQVRGAQPDRAAPLPYDYGRNRRENTPMYRRLPTDEEAVEFEGYRIPGQPVTPEGEEDAEGAPSASGATAPSAGATPAAAAPSASPTPAPGPTPSAPTPAPTAPTPERPTPTAAAPTAAPAGGDAAEAGEEAEDDPVTLSSLQGDPDSVLLRRLVSGFIVSLDRDFHAGPRRRRYWRTINNGFVPFRMLGRVTFPDYTGVRLDDVYELPVAFVTARDKSYYERADERVRSAGRAEFHQRVDILDQVEIGGTTYYESRSDGRLYREDDTRTLRPRARPDEVGPTDKWIEVNLADQYVIAYEGDRPVYATLISSGRPHHPDDPEADFTTPAGLFRIRAKHLAASMDGDTAADGPYSIDDVPYVMYFQLAYALHGAFWHNGFGFPRSHGCVNLAPRDAQWVFNWSDPQVPDGWHGAYPTEAHPGTWIYIHGETRGTRR